MGRFGPERTEPFSFAADVLQAAHWQLVHFKPAAFGVWVLLGVHASVTDLRHRTISRPFCWAAALAVSALLAAAAVAYDQPSHMLLVAAGVVPVLAAGEVLYRTKPDAIGYGDIRLVNAASILTAWWGPQWPWWALLAGTTLALPQAVTTRVRRGPTAAIAWAPALTAGTALVVVAQLTAHGTTP